MARVDSFKDLTIWQESMKLAKSVYTITEHFPKEEIYGLVSQTRRAAVSVPANIAEGFRRYSSKEFARFLRIAQGSLSELETELIIAGQMNYVPEAEVQSISEQVDKITRMISSLIGKLKVNY